MFTSALLRLRDSAQPWGASAALPMVPGSFTWLEAAQAWGPFGVLVGALVPKS